MGVIFHDNSEEVLSNADFALKRALEAIGITAEGYAKQDTPVDTGRLRNSIGNAIDGNSVYIGTNVEYGPYVELGSPTNKAHHMLQKAATTHGDEYKRLAEYSFRNA